MFHKGIKSSKLQYNMTLVSVSYLFPSSKNGIIGKSVERITSSMTEKIKQRHTE